MKESVIYQDIFAAGEARGLAIGEARGLVLGEAKALLRVLESRVGPVPESLRQRILAEGDVTRLEALLDRALLSRSIAELDAG